MNLTEKQLQELESIIFEIPTKYGIPLFNFFQKAKQENAQAEQVQVAKSSIPKSSEVEEG